jgi:hypothetical protein
MHLTTLINMLKSLWLYRFRHVALAVSVTISGLASGTAIPDIPATELIKQVVHNELADRGRPDVWLYHVEHTEAHHTESRIQADTKFGPVYRVLARDGVPLTPDQQRAEDARINSLLSDSSLQAKNRQQHINDEKHLENLMVLMPKAFIYEYDGVEDGLVRIKFRPDPSFDPPTYEARVFHGLVGTILIDPDAKRIARMEGTLQQPIEFGYGILGKLEKGGTFGFRRVPVIDSRWKTSLIELHIAGRVVLFKSVAKDQKEGRSDFHELKPETTLQEAKALLYKQ